MTLAGERLIKAAKDAQERIRQRPYETPEQWTSRVAPEFFADLASRQQSLGAEFEVAIFSEVKSLYEN
jgi:flagellar biosynthesis regulator FlaF